MEALMEPRADPINKETLLVDMERDFITQFAIILNDKALINDAVKARGGIRDSDEKTFSYDDYKKHLEDFDVLLPSKVTIDPRMLNSCLLYTSPSPRDRQKSRMPSSA